MVAPNPTQTDPRESWEAYFCAIAEAVKIRSRDQLSEKDSRVGAVIVREQDQIILSTGYNGPPRSVLDLPDRFRTQGEASSDFSRCPTCKQPVIEEKLCWMCHAEVNAIYNAARVGIPLEGAMIYTTKFPCAPCAGAIIQAGLVRLYTLDKRPWKNDPYDDGNGTRAKLMLSEAGISVQTPNFAQPGKTFSPDGEGAR